MSQSEYISKKLLKELDKLIEIARKKNNRLNHTIVFSSLFAHNFNMDNFNEIIDYFIRNDVEIIFENVELEDMNDDDFDKLRDSMEPFDQTKIEIIKKNLSMDLIIKRLQHNEIDLMPDFQRKAGLWNKQQKSRLIESLMLRIPLPAFYFDGSKEDNWLIIDGLQRLTTFKEFFVDKSFRLHNLEFLVDFEGCGYQDLPRTYVRRMEETELIAFVIKPGTPSSVKYNIFKRINTSGLELNSQEIRHALYQGQATDFLKKLSNNDNFLKATCESIRDDRMRDREFVLRYIAFREKGIEEYEGYIDDYLNEAMEEINNYDTSRLNRIESQFDKAMELSFDIFGNRAFRKMYKQTGRRNPINRALFDGWAVCFSKLSDEELEMLRNNGEQVIDRFIKLMNQDEQFADNYLNSSKKSAIKGRFNNIGTIVEEVLNAPK